MFTPQIVEKPAFTVVGLAAPFISGLSPDSTAAQVIGPLWGQFAPRASEVPGRIGHDMFGVMWTLPEQERSHPEELIYLAGVPVSSTSAIPADMVSRTIAASTFAAFTHRGPIQKITDTVREIYRVWLPQSGYRHSQVADVELYDHRFCMDSDESEMEYWISVVPKSQGA